MSSAKDKLRAGKPLTQKEMQELEAQGLVSPPMKLGKVTRMRTIERANGTVDFVSIEQPATVTRVPHYVEEGAFIEVTAEMTEEDALEALKRARAGAKAKERANTIERGVDAFNALSGMRLTSPSSMLGLTRWQLNQKVAGMNEGQLESAIEEVEQIMNAANLREKIMNKIRGDILVMRERPRTFTAADMSAEAWSEIEEETQKEWKPYEERFQNLEKAMPYLKENLAIYRAALETLKAKQPTNEHVEETQKRLEKLSKNADRIINDLEKPLHDIIYDRPTEERLAKAAALVNAYNEIEREFQAANKELEPFNITIDVGLRSLPILPDAVKKALGATNPETEKKRTDILCKFKLGR
jgi:tetratricopeptide (TPR) repeat protein